MARSGVEPPHPHPYILRGPTKAKLLQHLAVQLVIHRTGLSRRHDWVTKAEAFFAEAKQPTHKRKTVSGLQLDPALLEALAAPLRRAGVQELRPQPLDLRVRMCSALEDAFSALPMPWP